MPNDQELSPEEKLLRVIQSGKAATSGGSPHDVAPAPATAQPPASAAVSAPEADAGPPVERVVVERAPTAALSPAAEEPKKLRLSKPEGPPAAEVMLADNEDETIDGPRVAHVPDDARAGESASAAVAGRGAIPHAVPGKSARARARFIPGANRLLVAAILLILALIGLEIFAGLSDKPMPQALGGDILIPPPLEYADLPSEGDLLKLFNEKPWFSTRTTDPPPPPSPPPPVMTDVRLVGLSQLPDGRWEAILVDKSVDKMHFLKAGEKMLAGEKTVARELTLVRIERDHVVLTDGREEFVLR